MTPAPRHRPVPSVSRIRVRVSSWRSGLFLLCVWEKPKSLQLAYLLYHGLLGVNQFHLELGIRLHGFFSGHDYVPVWDLMAGLSFVLTLVIPGHILNRKSGKTL